MLAPVCVHCSSPVNESVSLADEDEPEDAVSDVEEVPKSKKKKKAKKSNRESRSSKRQRPIREVRAPDQLLTPTNHVVNGL